MFKYLKVKSQTPPITVASQREESGQILMSNLVMTELHPECGQQYIVTLFGKRAEMQFLEGNIVMAALNFGTRTGTNGTYQTIYADEIVKIDRNKIPNNLPF